MESTLIIFDLNISSFCVGGDALELSWMISSGTEEFCNQVLRVNRLSCLELVSWILGTVPGSAVLAFFLYCSQDNSDNRNHIVIRS